MDAISEAAGVAKPTVYAHFDSKEGLFEALLGELLGEMSDSAPERVDTQGGVEEALIAFATAQMDRNLSPRTLGLLRAASAEAMHRPQWAQGILAASVEDDFEKWLALLNERSVGCAQAGDNS